MKNNNRLKNIIKIHNKYLTCPPKTVMKFITIISFNFSNCFNGFIWNVVLQQVILLIWTLGMIFSYLGSSLQEDWRLL